MKYFILTFMSLFIFGTAMGQNAIDKNFSAYKSQDNFTKVSVKGKMFELSTHIEAKEGDKEMEEALEFIKTIKGFNAIYGKEMANVEAEFNASLQKVAGQYEELMSVDGKDGSFTLFIDESAGIVHELVMVGMKDKDMVIFSLEGAMPLKKLSKIASFTRSEEFSEMSKMFTHEVEKVKVYPNPSKANGQFTLEVPTDLSDATVNIYDLNGARVKTVTLSGMKQEIETSGLTAGTYIVKIEKGEVKVTKKVIVQ